MKRAETPSVPTATESARDRLKNVALQLFSSRGVDGVSVRDIVGAAKMRNGASLHYYFGSKEELVRELVLDAAIRSDERRRQRLEAFEARGGPFCLENVVRILIDGEIEPDLNLGTAGRTGLGHTRFILSVQINNRHLLSSAIEDKEVRTAYRKCLSHIKRFVPHLSDHDFRDRVVLMYTYITSVLAAREAAMADPQEKIGLWASDTAIDHLVLTTCALLRASAPVQTDA